MRINLLSAILVLLVVASCSSNNKQVQNQYTVITYNIEVSGEGISELWAKGNPQIIIAQSDSLLLLEKRLPVLSTGEMVMSEKFILNKNSADFLMMRGGVDVIFSGRPEDIINDYRSFDKNSVGYKELLREFTALAKSNSTIEAINDVSCNRYSHVISFTDFYGNPATSEVSLWMTDELAFNYQVNDFKNVYDMMFWNFGGAQYFKLINDVFASATCLKANIKHRNEEWILSSTIEKVDNDSLFTFPEGLPVKPFASLYGNTAKP